MICDEDPSIWDIDYPTAICNDCGEPCTLGEVDEGIGPYEFWGQQCWQSIMVTRTSCCESDDYE